MRDPHVDRLHYEIGSEEGISYDRPAPLKFSNHLGWFDGRDGKLVVEPAAHFGDEDDARSVVEPFLRSWEIEADLNLNIGAIRFRFLSADVVDRDPPTLGASQTIQLKTAGVLLIAGEVTMRLTRRAYPPPPDLFRATSDVQRAHSRWRAFRAGREPLQSMAYFVLTLVEAGAGGRRNAADHLRIDLDVLGTIGRLSSTRGDANTARKVKQGTALQDLTGAEKHWLEHAIRRLIRRLGEVTAGSAPETITMKELPELE